jgi:hypothetical protein
MNRIQFLILTSLSGVIALCIFLQIIFVRMSQSQEQRLGLANAQLQEGQAYYTHLQQIGGRIAQVAQQQQDQALKDLLVSQNLVSPAPAAGSAPAAPTPTTPATK